MRIGNELLSFLNYPMSSFVCWVSLFVYSLFPSLSSLCVLPLFSSLCRLWRGVPGGVIWSSYPYSRVSHALLFTAIFFYYYLFIFQLMNRVRFRLNLDLNFFLCLLIPSVFSFLSRALCRIYIYISGWLWDPIWPLCFTPSLTDWKDLWEIYI